MAGVPFLVIGVLFLVVGLFYGGSGIYEERIQRRLQQEGTDTKAVVIHHHVLRGQHGWVLYYVRYRYYHQGQSYVKEEGVSSEHYNDWPKGTLIPVHYLPNNPHFVRITSEGHQYLVVGKVLLGIGIFFMAVALLFTLTL